MHSRSWLLKIAVFFIPGVLFLIYIRSVFPAVKGELQLLWDEPKITRLVFILIVCFIAGGLIDFLRATVTSLVQWIERFGKQSGSFFEKLRISDGLTARTYNYQYLAFNISLSICVAWGLSFFQELKNVNEFNSAFWISVRPFKRELLAAFLLSVFTFGISCWNAYRAISKLKSASQQNKKCGGDTSCVKKCHPKDHPSTC